MTTLSLLSESELGSVVGGSWFSNICGDVSKALGRDGKPFIGSTAVTGAVAIATNVAVAAIPGGAPFSEAAAIAAAKMVEDKYKK